MSEEQRTVVLDWQEGLAFSGGAPDGPHGAIDGDTVRAPSPMQHLLMALGGCTGADVASMLPKMQVTLRRFQITVTGTRRAEFPKRFTAIHLRFTLAGEGLDEAKARRAIDLSLATYCSVRHTLDPAMPVTYDLVLA